MWGGGSWGDTPWGAIRDDVVFVPPSRTRFRGAENILVTDRDVLHMVGVPDRVATATDRVVLYTRGSQTRVVKAPGRTNTV
jgi:hypothetical protein